MRCLRESSSEALSGKIYVVEVHLSNYKQGSGKAESKKLTTSNLYQDVDYYF